VPDRVYSPHSVKRHVANLLAKLGASLRTEVAMRARPRSALESLLNERLEISDCS
jgi:hypothetical protein